MTVNQLPLGVDASDAEAAGQVPQQIVAAWANHDADAFAEVFTDDGSMILPNDVFQQGKDAIRSYMAGAFAGPYQNTQVTGEPVDIRFLTPGVALVITRGGVLRGTETEIAEGRGVLATWVLGKRSGVWKLAAYQNTSTAAA
jgi:uncharacterized protein (TIGR02246 family)